MWAIILRKFFYVGFNIPNYPEHLFFRWIELRIVIWHFFWEIGAKVISFMRLSHLDKHPTVVFIHTLSKEFKNWEIKLSPFKGIKEIPDWLD